MTLQPVSRRSFVFATLILNALVFWGIYVSVAYWSLYVAEYLTTAGLLLQVALVYRRESALLSRWRWRFWYALGIGAFTYLFLSSAYVPSPAPFEADEAEALLKTDRVILRHYAVFLIGLLPVLVSCSLTQSRSPRRQLISRALVTRFL